MSAALGLVWFYEESDRSRHGKIALCVIFLFLLVMSCWGTLIFKVSLTSPSSGQENPDSHLSKSSQSKWQPFPPKLSSSMPWESPALRIPASPAFVLFPVAAHSTDGTCQLITSDLINKSGLEGPDEKWAQLFSRWMHPVLHTTRLPVPGRGHRAHTHIPVVSEHLFCGSHKLEYRDGKGDMEENAFCCCYVFYQSL